MFKIKLKYLNKLNEKQIKELVYIFEEKDVVEDIKITKFSDSIEVEVDVIFKEENSNELVSLMDTFTFKDYEIISYDFYITQEEINKYKLKLYEYLGEQYLIDYMLNN